MSTSSIAIKKPKLITMGKPKPLVLSSFILLSPASMMKMDGLPMRKVFIQMDRETIFKGVERYLKVRPSHTPPKLVSHMKEMFDGMPDSDLKTLFLKALDGDVEAIEKVNQLGLWGSFRTCFPTSSQDGMGVWIDHCVEVENASVEIDALLHEGAYAAAADALKTNQTLAPYVSANAILQLTQATTDAEVLLPRMAGLCEFLLAQVARLDIVLGLAEPLQELNSTYQYLLSSKAQQTTSPGRELYQWLKVTLNIETFSEFHKISVRKNGTPTVDLSSLKRWSQGKEFPREDKLKFVIETIAQNRGQRLDDETYRPIASHYWVARRLHKLLDLVRLCMLEGRSMPNSKGNLSSLLGYSSADRWSQERYVFWLSHWRSLKTRINGKI